MASKWGEQVKVVNTHAWFQGLIPGMHGDREN